MIEDNKNEDLSLNVNTPSLVEPTEPAFGSKTLGEFAEEKRQEKKRDELKAAYDASLLIQSVDPEIEAAATSLKESESGQIVDITNDIIALTKSDNQEEVRNILSNLDKETEKRVRNNLSERGVSVQTDYGEVIRGIEINIPEVVVGAAPTADEDLQPSNVEVEIKEVKDPDLQVPEPDAGDIIRQKISNVTSENESVKKAWAADHFKMEDFEDWREDTKGPLSQRTQNPEARVKLREDDLKEYLGEKYDLYRKVYGSSKPIYSQGQNPRIIGYEDEPNFSNLNLNQLLEDKAIEQDGVSFALSKGRSEIAQITIEAMFSDDMSPISQIELIKSIKVLNKDVGTSVYNSAIKDMLDKVNPIVFHREFDGAIENSDPETFMKLFRLLPPEDKIKGGMFGAFTTSQQYLSNLVSKASADMVNNLLEKTESDQKYFDKQSEIVSTNFDKINNIQDGLFNKINTLDKIENKSNEQIIQLNTLIGKYKANAKYLNEVGVNEVGDLYNKQASNFSLQIDLLNDEFEKNRIGESEYQKALAKNYSGLERAAANLETQLIGGFEGVFRRISGMSLSPLNKDQKSFEQSFADKVLYTSQHWSASIEQGFADNASSTLASMMMFVPGGQAAAYTSFFGMGAGGKFKQIAQERETAEYLLSAKPGNLYSQIEAAENESDLWRLNRQLKQQQDVLDANWWVETGVGITFGLTDVVMERFLGTGKVARTFRQWGKLPANASLLQKTINSGKVFGLSQVSELKEESAVNLVNNWTDRNILGRDVGYFDGFDPNFYGDVLIGSMGSSGTATTINTVNSIKSSFQTRNEKKLIKEKIDQIADYDAQLQDENLSVKDREYLEDRKMELIKDVTKYDQSTLEKLNRLSQEQLTEISEADRKRNNALNVIDEIAQSREPGKALSKSEQARLDDAKKQYEEFTDQIDEIAGNEENSITEKFKKMAKGKSYGDFVYQARMARFNNSKARILAAKKGMYYNELQAEDLTDEFYEEVQKRHGPDFDIEAFKDKAENRNKKGSNAEFIVGGKGSMYVFLDNQDVSILNGTKIQGEIASVAAFHEILHQNNRDVGLIKDGVVTDAAKKGILGLTSLIEKKRRAGKIDDDAYAEYLLRIEAYRDKSGITGLGETEIETAGIDYEEIVNLVGDLQSIGAISRSDYSMLFGMKNFFNKVVDKTFGKHTSKVIDFSSGEVLFDYITKFNTEAYEGRVTKAISAEEEEEAKSKSQRMASDAFADSKVAEELGLTRQTKDIVETNDQVYRDIVKRSEKEGKSLKESVTQRDKDKLVTNNMPRVMALANQAARAAKNLTLDESLKIKDVNEWMSEYSLKLVELANSWDPAKNDSFGAYMNQLLPKKYSGILDKLKAKVETTSADREEAGTTAYNNVIDEGPTQDEVLDGEVKPKKAKGVTLVNDMVGLSDNIRPNESLDAIKEAQTEEQRQEAESKYQQDLLNTPLYKLVAKLNPGIKPDDVRLKPMLKNLQQGDLRPVFDMIVKEFGLDPNKVAKGATMPQGDIRAAQRFIANNFDLIIGSLPEGFDSKFKATGVQKVLLNAFYNQREVRSATKAGNQVWVKKPVNSILKDRKAAMAVFGLTEAGIPNIADKASNVAPPIQAVARWTASNITSQTIRELEANDPSPQAEAKRNALNDGKSKMLASKMVISMDKSDPAQGIEFRSMLPQLGAALEKINTLDKKSVRAVVEEVYGDILTKPQITQFVADLTKPKTGILARYDLLNKNYKEVKAELFDLKEFVEMEAVMTEQAAENQIAKILGVDVDRAKLLADANTVNRLRKTVITGFAIELENSGLSDVDIVRFVLAMKEMHASAGKIGKGENSTNGNPGGLVQQSVDDSRSNRQSGQITEGAVDFFALIKNGSQKVYDLMLLSDKGAINRKKLSKHYTDIANKNKKPGEAKEVVSFENYSESSAVVLKEIQDNTFSLEGREGQAKFNKDVTLKILEFVKDKIDEEILSKADALVVVGAFGSNMESPSRKAAYAAWVAENADTFKNPGKDLAYDHMKPHNVMMNQVVDAVFNTKNAKKKQEKIDEAFDDYVVGIIPEAFDTLIRRMGMQYNMQATYDAKATGLRGVLGRLYNDRTLGGEGVVAVRSLKTGDVVGEEFVRASEIIANDAKQTEQLKKADKAIVNMRSKSSKMSQGMSTFDFDETLIIGGKNSVTATKGDKTVKISSEDFPLKGPQLAREGYEFDFSDFANVKGGKAGPLMQKLKNQIAKYGVDNVFVLTARMQEAAPAIHEWLKTQGVELKLENITGLGNSTGEAKALWMLEKFGEGYNDMYFVDDALPNVKAVKNVLDQLDIKSKVRQAIVSKSSLMSGQVNEQFNLMLQRTKGIGAEKVFSKVVAEKRGKNIGKFSIFVPPSAEDFAGLLRYFAGTGKQGDADIKYLEELLIEPFNRAYLEMNEMRNSISEDYKTLRKQFPEIKNKLGKLMPNSEFTLDNAIRVYLWNKAGFDIPGLSKRDIENLVARVEVDQMTKAFADTLGLISKQDDGYIKPEANWQVETIALDLQNIVSKIGRKKFLAEWIENKNAFFTPENMNKIEAVYGSNFRSALEDILYRMETGVNRSANKSYGQGWTNWVNGSVGAIMFFNGRSAVLQTLSMVNFINFEDNNVFQAGKALANQKQYWSDFSMLFNSAFLKGRRAGLATNVNEAELANAVAGASNKAKAALAYLLKIGFTPTQIADSFAIASGGATFYRNRVNTYVKQGMDLAAAENQAMLDFQEIAEETQQSARPDRISQQQASPLGRLILSFANTPLQYNRLIKKAANDLINGRGDWRSNVSRILYYGAAQNFIFSAMQQALFAVAFDDEDDDEILDTKTERIANGMLDSLLRGSGIAGAVLSTVKNSIIEYMEQDKKGFKADYAEVLVEAINLSPPLGSKARKLYSAGKARKFNKDIMKSMDTFDYNNPTWEAIGNVTSALTNIPLDRLIRKTDNVREALNQDNTAMQRTFLMLGWDAWSLRVGEKKIINKGKENEYVKYLPLKQQAQEKEKEKLKKGKKKKSGRFGNKGRFN